MEIETVQKKKSIDFLFNGILSEGVLAFLVQFESLLNRLWNTYSIFEVVHGGAVVLSMAFVFLWVRLGWIGLD